MREVMGEIENHDAGHAAHDRSLEKRRTHASELSKLSPELYNSFKVKAKTNGLAHLRSPQGYFTALLPSRK